MLLLPLLDIPLTDSKFNGLIMKLSLCFNDVNIIAIPATGFVDGFRVLRTIQAVLVWRERFDFMIGKPLTAFAKNVHTSAIDDHVKTNGQYHFDILASGKTDYHCKIKETLFIQEL